MKIRNRKSIVALVLPMALFVAACGSSGSSDNASSNSSKATTTMADKATTTAGSSSKMAAPEGPGCAAVPTSGKGSFDGMAADPVATAASNNPALSTLVTAVTKAGLVDTLNNGGPYTVFAPVNDAFAKIPADTLNKVLADKATLTSILTYHVLPEQVNPDELGGTYKTVEGSTLKVSGSGPEFKVNDATVVCSGIHTANATVYLIDSVLMPPAN